ncbi:lytic transglycosylase domain-containing protein [Mycoplana rhizolycopersici]|uniref:Lytic transglycosylase domain-containing protein n=1 Tax=Mycoplana rhizolycopersici TaxID=2746702 RepID=A0ABX2QN32_9HYPH|nr:lytic transglycosylase domain-containing protein [Rhizobium rhizolycopersici]NVP57734.1 lytic transglycosylase domain-containing protein [Rhizobium rhizolycopersici]
MEKRARYKGYRGGFALVGTTLSALVAAHQTYAQDAHKFAEKPSIYNGSVTDQHTDLATNFEDRWRGTSSTGQEFVLGSDGVVSKENNTDSASHSETFTPDSKYNIGADINAYFHVSDAEPASITASRPTGSVASLGRNPQKSGGHFTTNECGPSPLDPNAIKALVAETARRHGVDEGFAVAIAWAESRFDQDRNSPKGARGPMQLIPETAARFGVQDICDPAQNIEGGMKYLRFLLDEFQNPLLVAAAYNSGEGRIYEYGGVPPFQETVGYVAKVVNFQLGLPMPTGKRKASGIVRDMAAKNTSDAGVIAVEKTGKFVGGVMHF